MNTGWFTRPSIPRISPPSRRRTAWRIAVAACPTPSGFAIALNPAVPVPLHESQSTAPEGHSGHHTIDLGLPHDVPIPVYGGPIGHFDHRRVISVGSALSPSDNYVLDFNYAYNDVYTATNICYNNGATPTLPGTAPTTVSGAPSVGLGVYSRRSTTQPADWYAKDFTDAPTKFGSVTVTLSPVKTIHSAIGYRISSVNGNQFFNNARSVNGSLIPTYQSPFANVSWTIHHGLIWKPEDNFFGYGEGGLSGPQFCATSTSATSPVVLSTPLPFHASLTEPSSGLTTPGTFHANNFTLGVHYGF